MKLLDVRRAAADAKAANPSRPATAVVHDGPHTRLVVFRLAPGQAVAPHTSTSTVMLSVLGGQGVVSGADGECAVTAGDVVVYEPGELHGMRAPDEELTLLATIAPRPGSAQPLTHAARARSEGGQS